MRTVAILSAFLLGCGTAPFDPDAGTADSEVSDSGMPHRTCEDDFDCLNGFRCNLNRNLCEPISDAGTDSSTNNNNSDAGNDSGMPDSGTDIDSGSPNFALNLDGCEAEIPSEIRREFLQPGTISVSENLEIRFEVLSTSPGNIFSRTATEGQILILSIVDGTFHLSINGTSVEIDSRPEWNEISITYIAGDGLTIAINGMTEYIPFHFRWPISSEIFLGGNGFIGMIDNIQFINSEGRMVGRWIFDDETLNDSSGNEHHMMSDCGFVER